MAERSVHEAARRVVARALCDLPNSSECPAHQPQASRVLAALVASAEVREGLVAALAGHLCPRSEECIDGRVARAKADAIIAALAGTDAAS